MQALPTQVCSSSNLQAEVLIDLPAQGHIDLKPNITRNGPSVLMHPLHVLLASVLGSHTQVLEEQETSRTGGEASQR